MARTGGQIVAAPRGVQLILHAAREAERSPLRMLRSGMPRSSSGQRSVVTRLLCPKATVGLSGDVVCRSRL